MSKRSWLLGVGALVLIGLLLACGSSFNSSTDGLLLVGSQGSGLIETFSFTLNNGHISAIANTPVDTSNQTCVLGGLPSSMVIDPAGVYAYSIVSGNGSTCGDASSKGIMAFKISSGGNITQVGNLVSDPNPVSLAMDSAGKFLYVAEGAKGLVDAYAIGSGGTLSPVAAGYTFVNGAGFQTPDISAVAITPTVLPAIGINGVQNAVCSDPGNNAPTSEYLYATDSVNNVVWEFSVDMSAGTLGNPPGHGAVASFPTDTTPSGVAVDPCNRFAYVSDNLSNKVSGYTICSVISQPNCPVADGSLFQIPGSPFVLSGSANGAGPIVVDPFGNNVYVVGTLSNTVSAFKISPVSGVLNALTPATVATGAGPVSIAIRSDDNWMFVANFGSTSQGGSTVSQYSVTPATGVLTVQPVIQTDNYPFGVAVK